MLTDYAEVLQGCLLIVGQTIDHGIIHKILDTRPVLKPTMTFITIFVANHSPAGICVPHQFWNEIKKF